jgi:hypothetical protein
LLPSWTSIALRAAMVPRAVHHAAANYAVFDRVLLDNIIGQLDAIARSEPRKLGE